MREDKEDTDILRKIITDRKVTFWICEHFLPTAKYFSNLFAIFIITFV